MKSTLDLTHLYEDDLNDMLTDDIAHCDEEEIIAYKTLMQLSYEDDEILL